MNAVARRLFPSVWLLVLLAGCSTIGVIKQDKETWLERSRRSILTTPDVSEVTRNILRRRSLLETYRNDPIGAMKILEAEMKETRDRSLAVAIAELAYLQSRKWTEVERMALNTTIRYSYAYLFDPKLEPRPQAFDAQFRWANDLYTTALADLVRVSRVDSEREINSRVVKWYGGESGLKIGLNEMQWGIDEFDDLSVAYDFVVEGLPPPDNRRGFGVPCILRRSWNRQAALEGMDANKFRYLPPDLAFPATTIVRFPDGTSVLDEEQPDMIIEILDPTKTVAVEIEGVRVPLEIDYVTPIAAVLTGKEQDIGIRALFRGDEFQDRGGLYMFQPYDPDKIMILMVHGLASDPLTWLPLYTDLMENETIRTRYQFAFWFYPTAQPVFYSAAQLRDALTQAYDLLDPNKNDKIDRNTVICGHSMGGILTRSLVVDPGTKIYDVAFDKPLEELDLPEEDKQELRAALMFEPVPFASRVIFYATPHRGSPQAKLGIAQWASGLLKLPSRMTGQEVRIRRQAKPEFRKLKQLTSVQALQEDNKLLIAMADLPIVEGVTFHSIMGDQRGPGLKDGTDGFVPYRSSHVPGAASEVIFKSGHSVQHTPAAARETERILLLHLEEFDRNHPRLEKPDAVRDRK
ncbi:MAG: alpha/beta hydrolase [Planctomycetota bacterium]